jgi:glutaredoxin
MLKGLGVSIKEYDIEKSKSARKDMRRLGGFGVPYIIIGNRKISGYNPGAMINALNDL